MDGCGGTDGKGSAQPCVKSRSVDVFKLVEERSLVSTRSGDGVADNKGSDGAKGETVVEVSQVVVVEMEKARDVRSCWSGNRRGSAQF